MKTEKSVPEKYGLKFEIISKNKSILGDYEFTNNVIGKGSYSEVELIKNINTGKEYAAKIIHKKQIKNNKFPGSLSQDEFEKNEKIQEALREIAILKKLNHDNIIKLNEILHDDNDNIYLILELIENGPLLSIDEDEEVIINKSFKREEFNKFNFSEEELQDLTRDIASGLHYMHSHNIIHGDIKPDNILLNKDNKCKITDFNFSKLGEKDDNFDTDYGNLLFNAPEKCDEYKNEIIHGKPLDVWALGVTLFMLTYKSFPYDIENFENKIEILDKITKGEIRYPVTRLISEELDDLFIKIFKIKPEERITIDEMLDHPWINKNRTNLRDLCKKELITVTSEELEVSLNFFNITLVKKCASNWMKIHRNSKLQRASLKNSSEKGEEQK